MLLFRLRNYKFILVFFFHVFALALLKQQQQQKKKRFWFVQCAKRAKPTTKTIALKWIIYVRNNNKNTQQSNETFICPNNVDHPANTQYSFHHFVRWKKMILLFGFFFCFYFSFWIFAILLLLVVRFIFSVACAKEFITITSTALLIRYFFFVRCIQNAGSTPKKYIYIQHTS